MAVNCSALGAQRATLAVTLSSRGVACAAPSCPPCRRKVKTRGKTLTSQTHPRSVFYKCKFPKEWKTSAHDMSQAEAKTYYLPSVTSGARIIGARAWLSQCLADAHRVLHVSGSIDQNLVFQRALPQCRLDLFFVANPIQTICQASSPIGAVVAICVVFATAHLGWGQFTEGGAGIWLGIDVGACLGPDSATTRLLPADRRSRTLGGRSSPTTRSL